MPELWRRHEREVMIALKLFFAIIVVSFIFVFLLAILASIPDFIVFVKDGIEETIDAWKKLPRRLR